MDEGSDITSGLQCCLICGRTVSDRELHDSFEERALASIRAEHPEWAATGVPCAPCVELYRAMLRERAGRAELPPRPSGSLFPRFLRRLVEKGGRDGK